MLSVHLLLNDETRGFLGAERLAKLRPGVMLVNTARGAIVDEAAMIAALRAGRVQPCRARRVHTEPLPEGHELATLPQRDPVGTQRVPHARRLPTT